MVVVVAEWRFHERLADADADTDADPDADADDATLSLIEGSTVEVGSMME